ncbi:MAG: thioredoxin family protein [Anaerolineales bacterium]|nr:thioredoxin family protein [Anaerolineales bacterium]
MNALLRLFSHNSYIWVALGGLALLTALLARDGLTGWELGGLALYGATAIVAFFGLRTPRAKLARFDDLAAFDKALRDTRPTLLEFYSENCGVCMAMRPAMDRLETDAGHRLQILRVNINDPISRKLAERYRVIFTPSFLLFNSYGGKEEEYTLILDRARVLYWLDQQTIAPGAA